MVGWRKVGWGGVRLGWNGLGSTLTMILMMSVNQVMNRRGFFSIGVWFVFVFLIIYYLLFNY